MLRVMLDANSLQGCKTFLATPEPPELGPGSRAGVQPLAALRRNLDVSCAGQPLVHAVVLLWHDHFAAAHEICQEIESPDGGWVHGILHRREPDYANAKYWFHRVGRHAAFSELARRAGDLLTAGEQPALDKIITNGVWDPFALVDACEQATLHAATEKIHLLRRIQAAEFSVLLEHLCAASETRRGK